MSSKRAFGSKSSSSQFKTASTGKNEKCQPKAPKKVVESKPVDSKKGKSCSTGGISNKTAIAKPKKTTQSDLTITTKPKPKLAVKKPIDFCHKCGDATSKTSQRPDTRTSQKSIPKTSGMKTTKKYNQPIQQYYKNERFLQSSESIHELPFKNILNPIKEVPSNDEKIFITKSITLEFLEDDNIEEIKEFRNENYFECHSSKTRIESKSDVSLTNHKCSFRFYLNERLFPVPFNTDHNNIARCTDCNLPLDFTKETSGTIQAKVNFGNENQTMTLILPMKENLIIKEKRKEVKEDKGVVYFGVVKLDQYGNSVFNPTLPPDSLALRYQKGYKNNTESGFNYEKVNQSEVIFI